MSRTTIVRIASAVAGVLLGVGAVYGYAYWRAGHARSPKPPARPPAVRPKPRPRPAPKPPPRPAPPPVWPLTNEAAPNRDVVRTRVVVAKVENSKPARPQTGLSAADVVYEVLSEGGITRFAAIFHSNAPSRVGPIRSGRPPDIYICKQYRALLARIGAAGAVENSIRDARIDDMNAFRNPGPYRRDRRRRAPHNLYVDIIALRKAAAKRGYAQALDPPALSFGAGPSGSATATVVDVTYNSPNRVQWRWNAGVKRYERWLNGSPHADAGSNVPYRASNVVVLYARTRNFRQRGRLDIILAGSGRARALVFRDGRGYEARWGAGMGAPPRLFTPDGKPLPLSSGKTWVEVVPSDFRGASFR